MSHPAIRDRARSVEVANEFRRTKTLDTWLDSERELRLSAIDEELPSYTSMPKPAEPKLAG